MKTTASVAILAAIAVLATASPIGSTTCHQISRKTYSPRQVRIFNNRSVDVFAKVLQSIESVKTHSWYRSVDSEWEKGLHLPEFNYGRSEVSYNKPR